MDSRAVLQEVLGKYGWSEINPSAWHHALADGSLMAFWKFEGRGGYIRAYFPSRQPWLIRLPRNTSSWDAPCNRVFSWPMDSGVDFDLRDPESLVRLEDYVRLVSGPLPIWRRVWLWWFG